MRVLTALTAAGLLFALAGCGSRGGVAVPPSASSGLAELPEVYRYMAYEKQPPPRRLDDLAPYVDSMPNAWARLQEGEYVLFYGVGLLETGAGAETVLAYEKKAPTEGGAVLLRNGTVKEMTAAEFQAAPKAK